MPTKTSRDTVSPVLVLSLSIHPVGSLTKTLSKCFKWNEGRSSIITRGYIRHPRVFIDWMSTIPVRYDHFFFPTLVHNIPSTNILSFLTLVVFSSSLRGTEVLGWDGYKGCVR